MPAQLTWIGQSDFGFIFFLQPQMIEATSFLASFQSIHFLSRWNLGFPATVPVIFIGLLRLKKRSTKRKLRGKDCPKATDRDRFESLRILAKFCSLRNFFATKKIGIFRARFIVFPSVGFPRIRWQLNIFVPFLVPVDKKNSYDQIWDRGKKYKIGK